MNFGDSCLLPLICLVNSAMTSDYVRRSVLETVGYRKLDLRDGGSSGRSRHHPHVPRSGADEAIGGQPSSSCVYVFGDEDGSEDELHNEDMVEPRPRNRVARLEERRDDSMFSWVEVGVKEDDTLTNIALRYNCKVSDIKRLNKLIKEQDFYGLKKIRIPVIRHGVIEEQLQLEDKRINSGDALRRNSSDDWHSTEFVDSIASSPSLDSQNQQAEQLLLRYDQEIQNTLTLTRIDQSTNDSVVRQPVSRQISKTLSWRTVLTFFVMFCVVIPIIGGLYFILRHLFGSSGD